MKKYTIPDYIFAVYWQKYLKAVMKRKIEKLYKNGDFYMIGIAQKPKIRNIDKELDKWHIEIKLIKEN